MRKGFNFKFFNILRHAPGEVKPPLEPAAAVESPPHPSGGYRWGRQPREGERLLSECHEGDQIVIRRLVGAGPLRRRLLEMGMNPGTALRVVKYAPLKDPLECEIRGYHMALRVSEAQSIIVTQA